MSFKEYAGVFQATSLGGSEEGKGNKLEASSSTHWRPHHKYCPMMEDKVSEAGEAAEATQGKGGIERHPEGEGRHRSTYLLQSPLSLVGFLQFQSKKIFHGKFQK
jgi:hypothetical protein